MKRAWSRKGLIHSKILKSLIFNERRIIRNSISHETLFEPICSKEVRPSELSFEFDRRSKTRRLTLRYPGGKMLMVRRKFAGTVTKGHQRNYRGGVEKCGKTRVVKCELGEIYRQVGKRAISKFEAWPTTNHLSSCIPGSSILPSFKILIRDCFHPVVVVVVACKWHPNRDEYRSGKSCIIPP